MDWIKSWEHIQDDKSYIVCSFWKKNGKPFFYCMGKRKGKFAKRLLKRGNCIALEITLPKSLEECR